MKCNFCGAELEEGVSLCAFCGNDNAQDMVQEQTDLDETPVEFSVEDAQLVENEADCASAEDETVEPPAKEKSKVWLIVLAAIGGVAILAVLVGAILFGLGIDLKPRANDVLYKDNYSAEAELAGSKADAVIATIGSKELTNGELQIYYWMNVIDFLNNYGYYLSGMGLDYTKPLNEQVYDLETGMTWQQFFLDNALSTWHRYVALGLKAQEENFVLDEEVQKTLDEMPQQLEDMATENGFASAQEMLIEDFGPGATTAGYLQYMANYYLGLNYFDTKYEGMVPSQEEITAYFAENEAKMEEQGISKDGKYYNVRHILIEPEGGTTDENGTVTYPDEAWEACLASAQALLDQWTSGDATEDSFAALATEHSKDPGSASKGGLYSQLTAETNFVAEFKDWYLDKSRAVGDTGLVKSVYGYHIMYFSGTEDIWVSSVSNLMINERTTQLIESCMEQFPLKVKYKNIVLGEISLGA